MEMKPILSYTLATGLALALSVLVFAGDSKDAKLRGPKLDVEAALRIAKEFVQKKNIVVTDQYIDSVRLEQNASGDRRKFWVVTWLRNEYANDIPIKGGQTYVYVYMDGTAEVFYGE